jgi:hypothetical protein
MGEMRGRMLRGELHMADDAGDAAEFARVPDLPDAVVALGQLAPVNAVGQRQGHVDPGPDPDAGNVVAPPDDTVADDLDARRAQVVAKRPVGRRALGHDQLGGGIEAGARAHGPGPSAARRRRPQPPDQDGVAEHRDRLEAS